MFLINTIFRPALLLWLCWELFFCLCLFTTYLKQVLRREIHEAGATAYCSGQLNIIFLSHHKYVSDMIKGVHTMFYSSNALGLRKFLRDKLGFKATDIGNGWLIFNLPEADLGVHPNEGGD